MSRHVRLTARQVRTRRIWRAAVAIALVAIGTVLAFTKQLPWAGSGYVLRAQFSSSGQLVPGDQVRIAGLPVGSVSGVQSGPDGSALVTLQLDSQARPVHADATLAVEPRLFLEGSFYVALRPGSPSAALLPSGAKLPQSQTTVPVLFDQLLDVFDRQARGSLQTTFHTFARGLAGDGSGGLRAAVRGFAAALPPATQVAEAAQGTSPGDLTRLVTGAAATTGQLAADPAALSRIVSDFNQVFGTLAARAPALELGVREADDLVRAAPADLSALDGVLPAADRFADALRPALIAAPGPLRDMRAALVQVGGAVSPGELPALVDELGPITANLPPLERQLRKILPLLRDAAQCDSSHVVPVLNEHVPDGGLSTGQPAWLELLHSGTGLSGLSSDFDANGVAVRAGLTAGDQAVTSLVPGLGQLVGSVSGGLEGVDPQWLGQDTSPPMHPGVSCLQQALPDLSARRIPGDAGLTASAHNPGAPVSAASVPQLLAGLAAGRRKEQR